MISYILPTRNRPECLARTLGALGSLPTHDAEVIVVDNAGSPAASVASRLANGLPTCVIRRSTNEGAAGRNAGAAASDAVAPAASASRTPAVCHTIFTQNLPASG